MFSLLVVLIMAFASAHAQQVRAQRLAQRALDELGESRVLAGLHPRDLFDALRVPSVNRVAPLAQLLRGRDAFFGNVVKVPPWRNRISQVYYLFLKALSWIVYFGFPTVALWMTFGRIEATGWLGSMLFLAGFLATIPLVQVFLVDVTFVLYVRRVIAGLGVNGRTHR
jgi:hypothetical protein